MIIKKNFNPLRVLSYVRGELLLATTLAGLGQFIQIHGKTTDHQVAKFISHSVFGE